MLILLLLVRATDIWVLFFMKITFVLNHTFNTMLTRDCNTCKVGLVLLK